MGITIAAVCQESPAVIVAWINTVENASAAHLASEIIGLMGTFFKVSKIPGVQVLLIFLGTFLWTSLPNKLNYFSTKDLDPDLDYWTEGEKYIWGLIHCIPLARNTVSVLTFNETKRNSIFKTCSEPRFFSYLHRIYSEELHLNQ